MKISDKNILDFGHSTWTYGRLIYAKNHGHAQLCVITKNEPVNVGDVYVMQFGRYDFELMNPVGDQAEANRCNDRTGVGRNCSKVIVMTSQLKNHETLYAHAYESVLVKVYPNMEGPCQDGWIVDNDVEGDTNMVTIHGYKDMTLKLPSEDQIERHARLYGDTEDGYRKIKNGANWCINLIKLNN